MRLLTRTSLVGGELRAPGRQSEYDRELARVTAEVQRLQGQGATGAGSYKAMEAQMVCGGVEELDLGRNPPLLTDAFPIPPRECRRSVCSSWPP